MDTQPDLNPLRAKLLVTIIAVLALSCTGLTIAVIRVPDFPDALFGLLAGVIGALLTKFTGGWDYFFATSAGSASKERIMAATASEAAATAAEVAKVEVAEIRSRSRVVEERQRSRTDDEMPIFNEMMRPKAVPRPDPVGPLRPKPNPASEVTTEPANP